MIRLVMPIFFLLFGLTFFIGTFLLPKAKLGDPNGPLYFPGLVSVILIILGLVYFVQEWKVRKEELEKIKLLLQKRTVFLIVSTLLWIVVYSLLFERIGFLFSTIIFLTGLLFTVNGKKKWLQNIIVSVAFSSIAWYAFAVLLQVSLP